MQKFLKTIKRLQHVRGQLVYVVGNENNKAFNAYKLLIPILRKSFLARYTGNHRLTSNATYKLKRLCFYNIYESKIPQFHSYMFYQGIVKDDALSKAHYHFYKFIGLEDNLPVVRLAKVTDIIAALDSYISLFQNLRQAIYLEQSSANPQGQVFFMLLAKLHIPLSNLSRLERNFKTKILPLRLSLEKCIANLYHKLNNKHSKWNFRKANYLRTYIQKLRGLKGQGVLGNICYVKSTDCEPISEVPLADMKAVKRSICESACQYSKTAQVYVLTHCGLNLRTIAEKYHIEPSQLQELRDNIINYTDLTYNEIFKLCDVFDAVKSRIDFTKVNIMVSKF